MTTPAYALVHPKAADGKERIMALRITESGELIVTGGPGGGVGGAVSPQDLADGSATAPSDTPANGSELNLLRQILDRQIASSALGLTATTNVNGTGYVALGAGLGNALLVVNDIGVDLEYRYSATPGVTFILPRRHWQIFATPQNSSTVSFRRADLSTTPVTLKGAAIFGSAVSATGPTPFDAGPVRYGHGQRANVAAGTALPLSDTSIPARWVTLQAATTNTGLIAYGGPGIVAASGGVGLSAGQSATIPCHDLSQVFFDSTVAGGVVRFTSFD